MQYYIPSEAKVLSDITIKQKLIADSESAVHVEVIKSFSAWYEKRVHNDTNSSLLTFHCDLINVSIFG